MSWREEAGTSLTCRKGKNDLDTYHDKRDHLRDDGDPAFLNRVKMARKISLTELIFTMPSHSWLETTSYAWSEGIWIGLPSLDSSIFIMGLLFKKLKIFRAVIGFILVGMVNMIGDLKRFSDNLFHYMSVLIDVLTIDPNSNIAIFHKRFSALPMIMFLLRFISATTSLTAIISRIFAVWEYPKFFFAEVADLYNWRNQACFHIVSFEYYCITWE